MEQIKQKYVIVKKTLITLDDAIKRVQQNGSSNHIPFRDSVIQRFEYTFDTFWKFIKLYLREYQKHEMEVASPRAVLRFALGVKVIREKELVVLLEALADRNLTTHTYNEDLAEEMLERIPFYYHVIHDVVHRIHLED